MKMKRLKDFVEIDKRFQNSINLQLDLQDDTKLESYIPTKSSLLILQKYLKSVMGQEQEKATILIGPYGKGKSHLLLVLLQILSAPENEKVNDLVQRISKLDAETAELVEQYRSQEKKFLPVMGFAFSTATSNATIPMSIDTLNKKMGVSKQISSFTIPLGATINMDGTSIMQGVAVIFIAEAYGIHLTPANLATVVVTATLASIGTAGIPSVGLVTLAMVLNSVGLPTEGIALIMGIDRILDMLRTAVNITGDAVCTTIVSHQEKALNREVFNRD